MTYLIIEHDIDIMENGDAVEIATIYDIVESEEDAKKYIKNLNLKSDLPERFPYYTYEENTHEIK